MKKIFFILALFIFLSLSRPAEAANDLKINSLSVSPTAPAKNEPCIITVTGQNNGDLDLPSLTGLGASDITYNFRSFEITKVTYPSAPIGAGKTFTYKFEGSFPEVGKKTISFNVNYNVALPESRIADNYKDLIVSIVEPYDYAMESITVKPSNPGLNEKAVITVKAKNNGFISFATQADIGSIAYVFPNFTVEKITNPKADYDENKIETNDTYEYVYEGKFTSIGKQALEFTLDPSDTIKEKEETNNYLKKEIEVLPLAGRNFSVYSLGADIAKPLRNEEIEITLKIKNSGNVSLVSNAGLMTDVDATVFPPIDRDVVYDLSDFKLTAFTKDAYPNTENPLDPNEYYKYVFTGYFPEAGAKKIVFTANRNKRLSESDYTEDATSTVITIYKDAAERDQFEIKDYGIEFRSSTTAAILWTTSEKSTGSAWCKRKDFTSFVDEKTSSASQVNHQVIFENLKVGTFYDYKIIATNGTEKRELTGKWFQTPAKDEIIFNPAPQVTTSGQNAAFAWTTNFQTTGEVKYKLKTATSYQVGSTGNVYKTAHALELKNLAPGEYEYYIAAVSAFKLTADSTKKSFTIATAETEPKPTETPVTNTQTPTETKSPEKPSTPIAITNQALYKNLKGKIVLKVEASGEAYYLNPQNQEMYYLGRPEDSFSVMRSQGVGITNANLEKIPIGLTGSTGPDADKDGLPDLLEDALGTDKAKSDTDNDGHSDKDEVTGGYHPSKGNNAKYQTDATFAKNQAGKIFLQIEAKGEAWYVNPSDNKRYFLGRPADAFSVMRNLGLGISNTNFESL